MAGEFGRTLFTVGITSLFEIGKLLLNLLAADKTIISAKDINACYDDFSPSSIQYSCKKYF